MFSFISCLSHGSNRIVTKTTWLHSTSPCSTLYYITGHSRRERASCLSVRPMSSFNPLFYSPEEMVTPTEQTNLHFLEPWQLVRLGNQCHSNSRLWGSVWESQGLVQSNSHPLPCRRALASRSLPSYLSLPLPSMRD